MLLAFEDQRKLHQFVPPTPSKVDRNFNSYQSVTSMQSIYNSSHTRNGGITNNGKSTMSATSRGAVYRTCSKGNQTKVSNFQNGFSSLEDRTLSDGIYEEY